MQKKYEILSKKERNFWSGLIEKDEREIKKIKDIITRKDKRALDNWFGSYLDNKDNWL